MKNVIKLAKGSLNNIFQDSFDKILSLQLTQDRSYIYLFKVDNRDDDAFWVGATDEIIEGIWKWYTDDSNLSYTNWARGQPDSHDGHEEDCLYLYGDNYGWHDGPCEAHKHALCEHR